MEEEDQHGQQKVSQPLPPTTLCQQPKRTQPILSNLIPIMAGTANVTPLLPGVFPPNVIATSHSAVLQESTVPGIEVISTQSSTQPLILPNVTPRSLQAVPGLHRGVIYAFSQYSPFIGVETVNNQISPIWADGDSSNLGPEDVAEVRQSAAAATTLHEHLPHLNSGKCQNGGELRLSELSEKLNSFNVPDGFCLVGAKSPMLPGMTLVAVVDKRYLPGDPKTITMLGFSGNCIGCGATGFRYFTEFSTHINLKLATQPKKQKHLKYYIILNQNGRWTRGPLIPWKGTETRKRSVPSHNLQMYGKTPELVPSVTMSSRKDQQSTPIIVSSMLTLPNAEPSRKIQRVDPQQEISASSNVIMSISGAHNEALLEDENNPGKDSNPEFVFKLPISAICGVRPVLLLCNPDQYKLPSSVNDIIVSDLLVDCFSFPSGLEMTNAKSKAVYNLSVQPIMSTGFTPNSAVTTANITNVEQNVANMLINMSGNIGTAYQTEKPDDARQLLVNSALILLTQYLCGLDDTCISKEQIQLMLNKSNIDVHGSVGNPPTHSLITSPSELCFLINLQCSASNGQVKAITSVHSFQNGLYKALRWIHETFYMSAVSNKKLMIPNFVIILSTPASRPMEFGVLVTGVSHAKILAECLGICNIVHSINDQRQNDIEQFESDLNCLKKQFQQTSEALTSLLTMFEEARENMVYVPFNAYAGMRVPNSQAKEYKPTVAPISAIPPNTNGIFSNQAAMAHQLLTQLRNIADHPSILDLTSFLRIKLLIVVPPTITLYYLTVKRLCESGVLNYLGLENEDTTGRFDIGGKYVITYSDWPESVCRWNLFVKSAMSNPDTLFLLIFDQAHRYSLPQGMPDVLPNLKDVFESVNVISVFVTSVPYMFQTRKSFIDPDNEVYWTDARRGQSSVKNVGDKCIMINDHDMFYFGIKEFCESTKWNQQYALIRHEETYDIAVPKANRLNSITYSTVQGFVLLRLYQACLMVAGGIKPAEPYAVMSVIRMINDVVESPLRNADGSGYMLMIRIPDRNMGRYLQEVLLETRDRVGFQYRFEVLYDDGFQELQISDYFLERMRIWKIKSGWSQEKASKWYPRCLEELLDLPCILILSGEDRSGETFPRSLKYADFNVFNHSSFHRSTIEAEIGSVSCYLSVNVGTHSAMSNKPIIMNNVRSGVGTTYLSKRKLQQVKGCTHQMDTLFHDATENKVNIPNSHVTSTDQKIPHSSKCEGCFSKDHTKSHSDTSTHFSSKYPLPVLLVSKPLWKLLQSDQGSALTLVHLNSDPNTRWIRSRRSLLTTTKPDRMSRYYRRWTDARPARKVLTTPGPTNPPSPSGKYDDDSINKLFTIGKYCSTDKTSDSDASLNEQIDHDDKDNEDSDKEQYHPRCLLLSGPPQAGKTGAYLHFAYLLHRMLVRLKRVDVHNNTKIYIPSSLTNPDAKLPKPDVIFATNLLSTYLDSRLQNFSAAHVCSLKTSHHQIFSHHKEEGPSDLSCLVILAKTASYDTYHHCDTCRFYREGLPNTAIEPCSYKLYNFGKDKKTIDLQVFIPPIHSKYFIIDIEQNIMTHLLLQSCTHAKSEMNTEATAVKTPIFMMSSSGSEEGLLNLFHSMEETDHVHITFIQDAELHVYQKHWPNHVFVVLPSEFNSCSDSAIKNLIKAFASQNYENEVKRTKADDNNPVWPFVLMVPDNIVMWQKVGKESLPESDSEEDEVTERKEDSESVMSPPCGTASLYELLATLESNVQLLDYGLIGVRPWSSYQEESNLPFYLRTFVHSCLLLNVKMTGNVFFSTHVYRGEDIDFQLRLLDETIPFCRIEHFTFMSKVTPRLSWRGTDEITKSESISGFIAPPDTETTKVLPLNAHLVLQAYLSSAATTLFPLAVEKPKFPVLIIGPYLDLGARIDVCVINCHRDVETQVVFAAQSTVNKTFSGLVVYNCSKRLPQAFLRQFKFLKDAQVVFVCKERYELRTEVIRLDLEDCWRFRLRDEYQTATLTVDDQTPLYFLTGSYTN